MQTSTASKREDRGMPVTKIRGVRIDEDLWTAAQEVAKAERETVADVVRRALVAYCREHGREV